MHVLFIHPESESLGVEYLSASLKKAGHRVSLIFDPVLFAGTMRMTNRRLAKAFSSQKRVLKEIDSFSPDLIAFSVVSNYYQWAKGYVESIKNKHPEVPIIFGGNHPTSVPEIILSDCAVDFVCVGEGEEAIVDLVNALETKGDTSAIPNIWCRTHDGRIIQNDVRKPIENLDSIPFPDKEIFYDKFPRSSSYSLLTTRGCPYHCSYCYQTVLNKVYKGKGRWLSKRSIDNVIQELKYAEEKYKKSYYVFFDEVFTYDIQWLKEFAEVYSKDIGKPTFIWSYPSNINLDVINALVKMKCFGVELGLQSFNEEFRKNILHRNHSNLDVAKAIALLKKANIDVTVDTMWGFPDEPLEDIESAIRFYNKHRPNRIFYFPIKYFPRTEILDKVHLTKEQIKDIEETGETTTYLQNTKDVITSDKLKIANLLYLFQIFPEKIITFIIDRKIYRYLPTFLLSQFDYLIFCFKQIGKGKHPLWHVISSINSEFRYLRWDRLQKKRKLK